MFRCQQCSLVTEAREPLTRVVVETRRKVYTSPDGEVEGTGIETVREERCCVLCRQLSSHSAAERATDMAKHHRVGTWENFVHACRVCPADQPCRHLAALRASNALD